MASDPSSYIPTTTAAVTRAQDQLRYPWVSNIDGALATTYTEAFTTASPTSGLQCLLFNGLYPQYYEAPSKNFKIFSSVGVGAVPRTNGIVNKNAIAWGGTTTSVCINGGAVTTGAFAAYPNSGDFTVGNGNPTEALRGCIRNVNIYATRLTDAQLIALTT